ncbi:hypothetical protein MRX96_016601 [Rhipicephalus microplus]
MVKEWRPDAIVQMEKLHVASSHVRHKPTGGDGGKSGHYCCFAMTWDANESILIQMRAAKMGTYVILKHLYLGKNDSIFGVAFGARPMLGRETVNPGECLGLTK